MEKRKERAFGKDTYLLGIDRYGDYIWLEAASWDCDWYWGFGYIEVYTRQKSPQASRDITSHSHFSGLVGYKNDNGDYIHHPNQVLRESVLTDAESWRLADLMKSFYTLKEAAAVLGRGGSHISGNNEGLIDKSMSDRINHELIPVIFEEVYSILSP